MQNLWDWTSLFAGSLFLGSRGKWTSYLPRPRQQKNKLSRAVFANIAKTKFCRPGTFNGRNSFPHSSRGQRAMNYQPTCLVSSEASPFHLACKGLPSHDVWTWSPFGLCVVLFLIKTPKILDQNQLIRPQLILIAYLKVPYLIRPAFSSAEYQDFNTHTWRDKQFRKQFTP